MLTLAQPLKRADDLSNHGSSQPMARNAQHAVGAGAVGASAKYDSLGSALGQGALGSMAPAPICALQ